MSELKCGRPCPIEHLVMDYDPNGCRLSNGHAGPHVCGNQARHKWGHPEVVSDERWRRVNTDAVGADRPHQVTATPLTHGGGWIYHCNACGYIDTTVPPIPCVPWSVPTWARPAVAEDAECCASGRCEVCTPGFDWGRDG